VFLRRKSKATDEITTVMRPNEHRMPRIVYLTIASAQVSSRYTGKLVASTPAVPFRVPEFPSVSSALADVF